MNYLNEYRFTNIQHPHIVKVINCYEQYAISKGREEGSVAYSVIQTEYAKNGDFSDKIEQISKD